MPPGQGVNGAGQPILLTTARWLNRKHRVRDANPKGGEPGYHDRWSKVLAHTGPYEQFAYGTDTPSDWQGRLQRCLICYFGSGLIAVDVDDEQAFLGTRTGQLIGRANAVSVRGDHFHIVIDARGVPEADWPRQGMIDSANHIKSKGFIPLPGCMHYSGERYEPVLQPGPVRWTPELIAAINADLADERERRRKAGVNGNGNGSGGEGGGHDGEIWGEVLKMVLRGLSKDECYAEWAKIAIPRDPGWPFTADDFERHYGSAARKAEQIRAEEIQVDPADVAQLAAMNQAQKPVQGVVVAPPKVVTKEGLLTAKAAHWVMSQGPLCYGLDNQLWAYQHGVWVPGEEPDNDIVHKPASPGCSATSTGRRTGPTSRR